MTSAGVCGREEDVLNSFVSLGLGGGAGSTESGGGGGSDDDGEGWRDGDTGWP